VHQDQGRRSVHCPVERHITILLHAGQIILRMPVIAAFPAANRRDFGANQAAINEIEREYLHAAVIACQLQVAIEESICKIRALSGDKIHHEKRDVAHYVDVTKIVTEFDAVKRRNAGRQAHQIGQVQVTMTFANVTMVDSVS